MWTPGCILLGEDLKVVDGDKPDALWSSCREKLYLKHFPLYSNSFVKGKKSVTVKLKSATIETWPLRHSWTRDSETSHS